MHAYDESYLNDAMDILGEALDYAVADCKLDPDDFFSWFVISGIAEKFGRGNPKYIAGMSGVELAQEVQFHMTGERNNTPATQSLDRTPEYWVGWFLAYYQWYRNVSFTKMTRSGLIPSTLLERSILHEADVSKAVAFCDLIMDGSQEVTRLAFLRHQRGFTQRQLADVAEVSLRMIQLYEQRQNDLRKASVDVVFRLAQALGCTVADLVE